MMARLTKETAGDLFVMQTRGLMASMIVARGLEPTPEQRDLLASEDITIRQLAEFAYDLGFQIDLDISERRVPECAAAVEGLDD